MHECRGHPNPTELGERLGRTPSLEEHPRGGQVPAELRLGGGPCGEPHRLTGSPSAMRTNPSSPASMDGHGGLAPRIDHGPDLPPQCSSRSGDRPADAGRGEDIQGEPPQLPVEGNHHGQTAFQLSSCLSQVPAPVVEPAEVRHGWGERHQAHPTLFMCSGQDLDSDVTHLAQSPFGDCGDT